jgi:hypothetical protein
MAQAASPVCRFTQEHSHLVSDLTTNEMANYLLRTETNRDILAYRRKELFEFVGQTWSLQLP